MILADAFLARRVEAGEAANAVGCTVSDPHAAALEVAGGRAVFAGAHSPLTQAVGLGMNGPVRREELDAMEEFFGSRGANPGVVVCPLADPEFARELGRRGYKPTEFDNVLARPLAGVEIVLTPRLRRALDADRDLWAHTVGHGFFDQAELLEEEMNVGRNIFAMPGAICYLAAGESGEAAGGGAMAVHAGLATLFADSTIARFRRLGLHRELIAARLNEAIALGCDMATASTLPGSGSQRNYERSGFQVVYTRVTMSR